jgi:Mg-chelatase subunit ChlD
VMQDSADSAVLAAANALAVKNLTDDEAIALAKQFMASQFYNIVPKEESDVDSGTTAPEDVDKAAIGSVERTTATGGKTYDVTLSSSYTMKTNSMTALLGWKTVTLKVEATAQSTTETKNALSMFLVLDRSGSMDEDTTTVNDAQPTYDCGSYNKKGKWVSKSCTNYYTKIDSLKLAVASLTTQLNTADPDNKYVRTAAVSYNASMQSPTSLEWGTASALSYVQALTATGGTDSSGAMARAYSDVAKTSEDTAHKNRNGQTPSKFIVFMTDGDNNYTSADTSTKATCLAAKNAGIQIFTVAFMAPTKGQTLLKYCASSTSNYYDAQNAAELVAAFKEIGDKAVQASTRLTN